MRARWFLLLPLAACSDPADDPDEVPPVRLEPTVAIVAPADGAVVSGTVEVALTLTDFLLAAPEPVVRRSEPPWAALIPVALAHNPDDDPHGYVEVRLDGALVDQQVADAFPVDVSELEAGAHVLQVELLWPDGDAFFPPVLATVGIVVE